jgi:hypothetical protein
LNYSPFSLFIKLRKNAFKATEIKLFPHFSIKNC